MTREVSAEHIKILATKKLSGDREWARQIKILGDMG
jgi:hypothetical protein